MKNNPDAVKPPMPAVLFGIPVDRLDTAATLDRIFAMIAEPAPGRCRMLTTLNVDFIVNAVPTFFHRGNPALYETLRRADLVTADGMPLVLLSRLLGCPIPERVTGADLAPQLAERAARDGKTIYFLGGTAESARAAAEILTARYPGLRIVGIDTPFVSLADTPENQALDREICAKINAAHPDLLFIGFGNPKQELWLAKNAAQLRVPAAIGIGGTFNFICGAVKRAPEWMRRSGLEWIYRVLQEPRRLWKRYGFGLIKFNWLALNALAATWVGLAAGRPRLPAVRRDGATVVIDCRGVRRVDNAVRYAICQARREACDAGATWRFEHLGRLAHWQLRAGRLLH